MNESEIFNAAMKLSAEERAKFLDLACKDNPALRQDVDGLLRAHDDSQTFLGEPEEILTRRREDAEEENRPNEFPRPPSAEEGRVRGLQRDDDETSVSPNESPGTMIAGKYKLLNLIGEGGMGSVWMAEQRMPVKRTVALKLIKAGMDSRAVLARFEAERSALALMDHPNIARILDGGMTEAGSPFFVMELVKGTPITEFCDARKLTPKERLELFVPVCQAIQHAHQKGIIHRDIKPSNVLIALYDDRPVPKVIDFGLAKATGQALTEATLNTGFNVIGTPQYMSPEQATFNQLDIDTRSDIYSLGVLLYELLAGSPPFKKQELEKAGLIEILRVIREEDPPRPSTKASTADGLPSISANRGIEPSKLTGLLRNELDWIVMKALEKDRSRRYETANGFAADINRYLAGEAVLAHPPSRAYRLKKFLRKNKGPVLAASLVFLALFAGIVGTSIGLWQANAQRKVADDQRAKAVAANEQTQKRADELKQVSDFQAGMLAQVDPTEAGLLLAADLKSKFAEGLAKSNVAESDRPGRIEAFNSDVVRINATDAARELIDRTILKPAIKTIDENFKDQPLVDAQLRQTLATLYLTLGLYDAALPLQERALATRKRVLGDEHPETLQSMNEMGLLLKAQGKLTEAESYFRDALEKNRRGRGEDHLETLTSLNNVGTVVYVRGNLDEAEALLRESVEKHRRVLGDDHPKTLGTISNLAGLKRELGKLDEAEALLREALETGRRVLERDDPDILGLMHNLGALLLKQGKLSEAEPLIREALAKKRQVLGESHPSTLFSICALADLLQAEGKLDEAEVHFRDALEKRRRVLGDEHVETLASIGSLGSLLQAQDKPTEAAPYLIEAQEMSQRILGDEHPMTLRLINNLAMFYWSTKQLDKSVPLFEGLLKRVVAKLGRDHPESLKILANLGVNYKDAGRVDEAIPLLEEAYTASKKIPTMEWVGGQLLDGYMKAGKKAEAESFGREALAMNRRVSGDDHPQSIKLIGQLGMLLQESDKLDDAEPLIRECLERSRRVLGEDHLDTLNAISNLGSWYQARGNLVEAEEYFRIAVDQKRAHYPENPDTGRSLVNFGSMLRGQGKLDQAEPVLREGLAILRETLGVDHPHTHPAIGEFARLLLDQGKLSEAEPLLRKTIEIQRRLLPKDSEELLASINALAVLYWKQKQLDLSIPLFEELANVSEQARGRQHPTTLSMLANLGVNHKDAGHLEKAVSLLEETYSAGKSNPENSFIAGQLIDAYIVAGQPEKAMAAAAEAPAQLRSILPKDSVSLSQGLYACGRGLIRLQAWKDAEPILRESLAIREKNKIDDPLTFAVRSMLGGSLLGQGNYADAEPFLLEGYNGLKVRDAQLPPNWKYHLGDSIQRIVELYTATDRPDKAAEWQKKLDEFNSAASANNPPATEKAKRP